MRKVCTLTWCLDLSFASVTYPLWLLKTREQDSGASTRLVARQLWHQGPRCFYRGALLGTVGLMPAHNAYLCTYEWAKFHAGSRGVPSALAPALAAPCAECAYLALGAPVEVATVRAQCAAPGSVPPRGVEELAALWRSGGLARLYRGWSYSLAASLPESALWWLVYENAKVALRQLDVGHVPAVFSASVAASVSSTLIVNPLDVLKTRAQVGRSAGDPGRPSLLQLFTRGLTPRLIAAGLAGLFESSGYEAIMHYGQASSFP